MTTTTTVLEKLKKAFLEWQVHCLGHNKSTACHNVHPHKTTVRGCKIISLDTAQVTDIAMHFNRWIQQNTALGDTNLGRCSNASIFL